MSENEGADAEPVPGADEGAADAEAGASDAEEDASDAEAGAVDGESRTVDSDAETAAAGASDDLLERVAESDPETLADEIAGLRERAEQAEGALAEREEEIDDLESRLKRTQADFQNYKKRQEKRREEERTRATEHLVERLLEVRDNLDRALEQDADADIREGVEATFRLLDEVLEDEGVEPIEPDPGAETDPQRHEVLLTVESDQPDGTVAEVHRPGYEMAGKVLRPAQVTVADGDDAGGPGDAGGTGDDAVDDRENEDE